MNSRRNVVALVFALSALAFAAHPVAAQTHHLAGGYLIGSFPTGDWGEIAGFGMGLEGTDIVRMAPEKPFEWRLTTGLLYNFSRTVNVPPSNLGPNSALDLETKNWTYYFGVGPELAKRGGDILPFIYGTAGFDTYWTSSTLSGTAGGSPYEAEHGDSRISFAWAAGIGIRRRVMEGHMGEISLEYRSGLEHHFVLPSEVTNSGTQVFADRASRVSDQILLRVGTVLSDH